MHPSVSIFSISFTSLLTTLKSKAPLRETAQTAKTHSSSTDDARDIPLSSPSSVKQVLRQVAPTPTEVDTEGKGLGQHKVEKTLRQRAMDKLDENPSQLGDPISLKAETAESEPTDEDRGAGGKSGRPKL